MIQINNLKSKYPERTLITIAEAMEQAEFLNAGSASGFIFSFKEGQEIEFPKWEDLIFDKQTSVFKGKQTFMYELYVNGAFIPIWAIRRRTFKTSLMPEYLMEIETPYKHIMELKEDHKRIRHLCGNKYKVHKEYVLDEDATDNEKYWKPIYVLIDHDKFEDAVKQFITARNKFLKSNQIDREYPA